MNSLEVVLETLLTDLEDIDGALEDCQAEREELRYREASSVHGAREIARVASVLDRAIEHLQTLRERVLSEGEEAVGAGISPSLSTVAAREIAMSRLLSEKTRGHE